MREVKSLTGIRGIAAFTVMIYHYAHYQAFPGFHVPFLQKGYLAVDLFFILSGFLLALRYGDKPDYGKFLKARFARIYPAYFVISLLYYLKWVVNTSGTNTPYSPSEIVANLFLVHTWGLPVRPVLSDSWSVSVEVAAYLLFPLLMACKRPLLFIAATVLLFGVTQWSLGTNGALDIYRTDPSPLHLLRCLAGFSIGIVAASYAPACMKYLDKPPVLGIIITLMGLSFWLDKTDIVTVMTFPLLLLCLYAGNAPGDALFGNALAYHLGQISYSLYLLHPLFMGVAGHYGHSILTIALGILATWMTAYLSYRLIEVKGRNFLNR